MGPTGNLRAPTARIGTTLVVGFNDEAYRELLGFAAPPNIQGIALTLLVNKLAGGDYKVSIDPAIAKLKSRTASKFSPSGRVNDLLTCSKAISGRSGELPLTACAPRRRGSSAHAPRWR